MTIEEIGRNLPALLGAMMLAILFIQSGLEKFSIGREISNG
jgi:hypothetical protein